MPLRTSRRISPVAVAMLLCTLRLAACYTVGMRFVLRAVRVVEVDEAQEDLERDGVHAVRVGDVHDAAMRLVGLANDRLGRGLGIRGDDRRGRELARRDVVVQ